MPLPGAGLLAGVRLHLKVGALRGASPPRGGCPARCRSASRRVFCPVQIRLEGVGVLPGADPRLGVHAPQVRPPPRYTAPLRDVFPPQCLLFVAAPCPVPLLPRIPLLPGMRILRGVRPFSGVQLFSGMSPPPAAHPPGAPPLLGMSPPWSCPLPGVHLMHPPGAQFGGDPRPDADRYIYCTGSGAHAQSRAQFRASTGGVGRITPSSGAQDQPVRAERAWAEPAWTGPV
jgi:hypothetical protein